MTCTSDDGPIRVHCPRSPDLAVHAWSDGVVVYDDANGSLHALSPVAGEALKCLLTRSPMGATRLAELLVQEPPDGSDIATVAHLLTEFEGMGFVERLPV